MASQAMSLQDHSRARGGLSDLRALGRMLAGAHPGPGLDWDAVLPLARGHGLSPLLYFRLFERTSDQPHPQEGALVPDQVAQSLRIDYHTAVARRMVAQRQLAAALGALSAAHVATIVLKGPVVADSYPHPALRAYGDLDLLVREGQLDTAEEALNRLGYVCARPKTGTSKTRRHLPPMITGQDRLPVELHSRLDDPGRVGRLPVVDLWARAVPWSASDQQALRLDDVDAVLYLCRHAAIQHWGRWYLRSAVDLAQMTAGWGRGEWEALVQRAAAWELSRAAVLMLVLVEQVLGGSAPAGTMVALHPTAGQALPEDLAERLLEMDREPVATLAVAARAGLDEPWLGRVRRLWRTAFQRRAQMATKYGISANSPRAWLTYLWRPVDLLQRYGPSVWHTLRRDPPSTAAWSRAVWLQLWLRGDAE